MIHVNNTLQMTYVNNTIEIIHGNNTIGTMHESNALQMTHVNNTLGLIGYFDRVLRSNAHVIGHSYASISTYTHDVLLWLSVFQDFSTCLAMPNWSCPILLE